MNIDENTNRDMEYNIKEVSFSYISFGTPLKVDIESLESIAVQGRLFSEEGCDFSDTVESEDILKIRIC